MAENSERKKCQQNLLNYVSHNLNSKVDKEKEKEKERSEGKSSADKPSATSAKQHRPKQSAQGPGNQSTGCSSGKPGARGGQPTHLKKETGKSKGNTPNPTQTPKACTPPA